MEGRRALIGLLEGDTAMLVEHLRSGAPIDDELATALADLLDPASQFDWKVRIMRRTKNRSTPSRAQEASWKMLEVGAWAHVWIEGHPHGLAQIIRCNMAERFEVGQTYVRAALAHFRKVKGLWEGEHNDYSVLQDGAGGVSFDIAFGKEVLAQAEDALATAIAEMSEDKNQISDSNSLGQ